MNEAARNHRERILEAAQSLILSKGFPATRVDEVCVAAGVTKGSFYHHFESKDELAMVLVDHYYVTLAEQLCAGEWAGERDSVDRLRAFLDHAIKVVKGPLLKRGCLLGSFALDLSQTHPKIRAAIEDRLDRLTNAVTPTIREALKQRSVKAVNAAALARQFVSVLQGSIVLAKAYGDHAKVTEGIRCYRVMVDALLGM